MVGVVWSCADWGFGGGLEWVGGFSFGRVGCYAVNGFCVALEGGCVDGRMCLFVSF